MKLNEGEIHSFQVINIVTIEGEGDFYVLRHNITGRRLLLPVEPYSKYSIKKGQQITCRVDKVNCTGKVFLEPKHPYYEEGKSYPFDIVSKQNEGNNLYYIVSDCFENQIKIPFNENNLKIEGEKLFLKVDRIKKGVPLFPSLILNSELQDSTLRIIGRKNSFKVKRITQDTYGKESYLLESTEGYQAFIRVKHFCEYGIKVGNTILCEVISVKTDNSLEVEPVNPYYKINEVYSFKIIDNQLHNNEDDFTVISVIDDYDIKSSFKILATKYLTNKNKTRALCRVIGFRKGRPKLELIEFL